MTEENSSGLLLLSKIINFKLPRQFLIEPSRGTNYPNFNQLVEKISGHFRTPLVRF